MATKYFITISPPYRAERPQSLYEQDRYIICKYLNQCSKYYCLYPEFSKDSRLHYHGIIRLDDPIKWYKNKHVIDKVLGWTKLIEIKSFKEHIRSLIYSQKNWASTRYLLEEPIIYRSLKRRKSIQVAEDIKKKTIYDYLDKVKKDSTSGSTEG